MTLNADCIRDLLLYLEENLSYMEGVTDMTHKKIGIGTLVQKLPKYTEEEVKYTIEKLHEAGYIHLTNVAISNQGYIMTGYVDDITWDGFEFLNRVREPKIWEATKKGAAKIGSMSIATLSTIAFEIIKNIATRPEIIDKIMSFIHWT